RAPAASPPPAPYPQSESESPAPAVLRVESRDDAPSALLRHACAAPGCGSLSVPGRIALPHPGRIRAPTPSGRHTATAPSTGYLAKIRMHPAPPSAAHHLYRDRAVVRPAAADRADRRPSVLPPARACSLAHHGPPFHK